MGRRWALKGDTMRNDNLGYWSVLYGMIVHTPVKWFLMGALVILTAMWVIVCTGCAPAMDLEKSIYATVEIATNRGGGAGVIYDMDDTKLYILTARHVVTKHGTPKIAERVDVQIRGSFYRDRYHGLDKSQIVIHDELDIAHLVVEKNLHDWRDYQCIPIEALGKSPRIGDTLYTIGHPLSLYYTVNRGMVAQFRTRQFNSTDKKVKYVDKECMLLNAGTYPGNSGGPVINSRGKLVGIMFGILYDYEGMFTRRLYNHLAWSLKHEDLVEFVEEVRK